MKVGRGGGAFVEPPARGIYPLRTLLPLAAIGLPLAAPFTWRYSAAATLGATLVSHAAYCYASLRANCRWCGPVVTRFATEGNEVWLTIDDGPCPEDTPRLLDLLDAAGARATFFVRGDRARAHPELVCQIVTRGNGVANHTFHHPQYSFWSASPWRVAAEIDRCCDLLRELTGHAPRWFRAPVGMANPFVHSAVAARGLRLVGWSNRGLDTLESATPASSVRRIMRGLRPGAIVLLHEGKRNTKGERLNPRTVGLLLETLAGKGLRSVVPADERLI